MAAHWRRGWQGSLCRTCQAAPLCTSDYRPVCPSSLCQAGTFSGVDKRTLARMSLCPSASPTQGCSRWRFLPPQAHCVMLSTMFWSRTSPSSRGCTWFLGLNKGSATEYPVSNSTSSDKSHHVPGDPTKGPRKTYRSIVQMWKLRLE